MLFVPQVSVCMQYEDDKRANRCSMPNLSEPGMRLSHGLTWSILEECNARKKLLEDATDEQLPALPHVYVFNGSMSSGKYLLSLSVGGSSLSILSSPLVLCGER